MENQRSNIANASWSWRKKASAGLLTLFGVWAAAAAWLLATAWYSVPGYAPDSTPTEVSLILTPELYSDVIDTHERPYNYVLDVPDGGRVAVFGAEHTKQPDDPQFDILRAQWQALKPTVALIESDLGMMFPMFMDPVRTFGEVGEVHALARSSDIKTYTWEPPDEKLIQSAIEPRVHAGAGRLALGARPELLKPSLRQAGGSGRVRARYPRRTQSG